MSTMMSSLVLLGDLAEFSSCQFSYLFPGAAIYFVLNYPLYQKENGDHT